MRVFFWFSRHFFVRFIGNNCTNYIIFSVLNKRTGNFHNVQNTSLSTLVLLAKIRKNINIQMQIQQQFLIYKYDIQYSFSVCVNSWCWENGKIWIEMTKRCLQNICSWCMIFRKILCILAEFWESSPGKPLVLLENLILCLLSWKIDMFSYSSLLENLMSSRNLSKVVAPG